MDWDMFCTCQKGNGFKEGAVAGARRAYPPPNTTVAFPHGRHAGSQGRPMHYLLVNHRHHRGLLGPSAPRTQQIGLVNIPSAIFQPVFLQPRMQTRAGASRSPLLLVPGTWLWVVIPFLCFSGGGGTAPSLSCRMKSVPQQRRWTASWGFPHLGHSSPFPPNLTGHLSEKVSCRRKEQGICPP